MDGSKLIAAFQDTVAFSESEALRKKTAQAAASSKVYLEHFQSRNHTGGHTAKITVEENTTFSAAKKYLVEGKTAVLNFANPVTPGGGVQNGAMAQEECLCRSSNLYVCLTSSPFSDYYQYNRILRNSFYSDRLIYTKGVTVFKSDDDIPGMMSEQDWFQVDVITCAAPYIAERKYTNRAVLKSIFKSRIKNIFEAAVENGCTTLILGAFGCGAFKNPPEVVASAFHEVIKENRYEEQFDQIVFAIKSTVGGHPFTPCPNIMAFEQEFYIISADASKLRFGDNWVLSQTSETITLPSGCVLNGGERFNPYLKWKESNPYFRKQFSILGDSISTLDGYNPKEYNLFYTGDICDRTGVREMKDTWWGKVIDYFGGELLVNNSWSGSRVTKLPNQNALFPSGCSTERTGGLHIGEVMPDVIIVYLGTNDWAYGVRANDDGIQREYYIDEKTGMRYESYPSEDISIFSVAYECMLNKIKQNYPNAEVYCCTLNETYMSSNPSFSFPHSYAGTHIEYYNTVIRKKVESAGCKLIELYNNHIPYDAIDGSHPTAAGMNTLATLMLRGICDDEGAAFLNCEGEHDFITAEVHRGVSKCICKKCGKISTILDDEEFYDVNPPQKCPKCQGDIEMYNQNGDYDYYVCKNCGNKICVNPFANLKEKSGMDFGNSHLSDGHITPILPSKNKKIDCKSTNIPPKKGLFGRLFGKKKEKSYKQQQQWNPTVVRLYNGMNANGREKIFYGGIPEAQLILLSLADSVFHSTADDKLELCCQIYVQCWLRSKGGLGMQFRTPTYIKQMLVQKFPDVPERDVVTCVEHSLKIIYQHEPQLMASALSGEIFMANTAENAKRNFEIQDQYLQDEEYGRTPDKPIFVNGFGYDKEYLSHLYTTDGVKLAFERTGSLKIENICGPVDFYNLLLPDGNVYMQIFLCNYGTRNTTDVPKGILYR